MTKELKDKILKIANETGKDIDGDMFKILGKTYYVHILDGEVTEVK